MYDAFALHLPKRLMGKQTHYQYPHTDIYKGKGPEGPLRLFGYKVVNPVGFAD
jgi:hypothetical protein